MKILEENIKYSHVEYPEGKSFYYDHVHINYDEQIGFHQQLDWEISYVIKGRGTRLIGDVMEPFYHGEVVLLPPDLPHGWIFSELEHDEQGKIENITIIFQDSWIQSLSVVFKEMKSTLDYLRNIKEALKFEGETLLQLQQLMVQMKSQSDVQQIATLMNLFTEIATSSDARVVGYSRKQTKSARKLREIYRYIIHNYQQDISIDEVSRHFGMNRSSFCSFYKRETGKTFVSALNEYRINCACMMLSETNKSVSTICFDTGFNDVPYFNRTFKKHRGMSPVAFKKAHTTMAASK